MVAHNRLPAPPAARRRGRARASARRRARDRRRDDAGEVQRIGGADRRGSGRRAACAAFAQPLDGVGERELFTRHAGDEAAAADLAAGFEAAVDAGQLAPRRDVRLRARAAGGRRRRSGAAAIVPAPRPPLRACSVAVARRSRATSGRRPARGGAAIQPAARGAHQRAQAAEAVGGDQAGGDERRRAPSRTRPSSRPEAATSS